MERLAHDRAGVVVHAETDRDDEGLLQAVQSAWTLLPWPRCGSAVDLPLLGVEVDLAGTIRATGPSLAPAATERLLGLVGLDLLIEAWLLCCSDDLVVLRRHGVGELRAELLAVCFPSGWPVRERAGASLAELHGPVADGERLQAAAPALSEALLTKGPFLQYVWGLDPSGRLDRDPTAADAEPASSPLAAQWWLRVERQTTLALPDLGRALFTIRPYLVPLPSLTSAQRQVLHDAIASMSPEALRYKGISEVRDELLSWLAARVEDPGAAQPSLPPSSSESPSITTTP